MPSKPSAGSSMRRPKSKSTKSNWPGKASRSGAARSVAAGSRSNAMTLTRGAASSRARVCPPPPNVQSRKRPPGSGARNSMTSRSNTGWWPLVMTPEGNSSSAIAIGDSFGVAALRRFHGDRFQLKRLHLTRLGAFDHLSREKSVADPGMHHGRRKGSDALVGINPSRIGASSGGGSAEGRFTQRSFQLEALAFCRMTHAQMSRRRIRSPKFSPAVRASSCCQRAGL